MTVIYDEWIFKYMLIFLSTMVSPILSILANDKLNWENYIKWKSNMNSIMVSEDLDFILTEECPPKPTNETDQTIWEAYKKWLRPIKGPAIVY